MPLNAAIDYLGNRDIGDFVIRPSGQGNDHLNITWKLSAENIVHLDIKEGFKGEGDTISKHLTLDKEIYESLDEIIERYIKPCNHLINQIRDHKKFLEATLEYVKETLVEEKKNDQNFIPYYMSFISEAPQYLILSYIPRHYEVMHEYIKIKPDGLVFHEQKFGQLKRLITWFKAMLKTPEYQKYLEHTVPPAFDLNKKNRDLRVKEEFAVKKEGRDPKREKKREKDSVYKQRPTDNVKRRRTGSDEENRYSSRGSQPWGQNGWDDNNDNQRDWNPDWDPKQSRGKGRIVVYAVKREGDAGRSRSRSRSQDRRSRQDIMSSRRGGKKSVASKESFNSEYLQHAWGAGNGNDGEEWQKVDPDQNDTWGAKSEIKNENEWGTAQSRNDAWEPWGQDSRNNRNNNMNQEDTW